jgi:ABC-type transporter Mla subunit MlaD
MSRQERIEAIGEALAALGEITHTLEHCDADDRETLAQVARAADELSKGAKQLAESFG